VAGRDPEDLTPADLQRLEGGHLVAARVLSERTGRLAAELMDWPGVRLLQDNLIWKPPGTKSLGMDQHGSYLDCLVPPEMVTCWIDARRHLRRRGDDHVRRGVTPLATVRREPE
jgi:2-oxoglutarate-dependent dioxygenase